MEDDHIIKKAKHLSQGILGLELNRPQAANALSLPMIEEFVLALKEADRNQSVRVIYVAAAGKVFCAGGDIKEMAENSGMFAGESNELRQRYERGIQQIPLTIEAMGTPLIAKIDGAAIGAGLDLAAMCDMRIGTPRAKFAETFSKLALVPGDGGTWFLSRLVGYAKALEMFLTGDFYSAHEAFEMGLLNKVVQKEDLDGETLNLCLKIAGNSPVALEMTKKALRQAHKTDLAGHLDLLSAYQGITQRTQDHYEGLKALKEKRKALFMGL